MEGNDTTEQHARTPIAQNEGLYEILRRLMRFGAIRRRSSMTKPKLNTRTVVVRAGHILRMALGGLMVIGVVEAICHLDEDGRNHPERKGLTFGEVDALLSRCQLITLRRHRNKTVSLTCFRGLRFIIYLRLFAAHGLARVRSILASSTYPSLSFVQPPLYSTAHSARPLTLLDRPLYLAAHSTRPPTLFDHPFCSAARSTWLQSPHEELDDEGGV